MVDDDMNEKWIIKTRERIRRAISRAVDPISSLPMTRDQKETEIKRRISRILTHAQYLDWIE